MRGPSSYNLIRSVYKERSANHSGIKYMNHIDEGLHILRMYNADEHTMDAFCLHPLVQGDSDLVDALSLDFSRIHPTALILAMEYRRVANAYLLPRKIKDYTKIMLSPLPQVNLMLVADKIQNRKDMLASIDGRSNKMVKNLNLYFKNWLQRLEVSETRFAEVVKELKG